jgi:hypothetical protein
VPWEVEKQKEWGARVDFEFSQEGELERAVSECIGGRVSVSR